MTGPEISALVGAGVALITAAASYLRSVAAHNAAKAANAQGGYGDGTDEAPRYRLNVHTTGINWESVGTIIGGFAAFATLTLIIIWRITGAVRRRICKIGYASCGDTEQQTGNEGYRSAANYPRSGARGKR